MSKCTILEAKVDLLRPQGIDGNDQNFTNNLFLVQYLHAKDLQRLSLDPACSLLKSRRASTNLQNVVVGYCMIHSMVATGFWTIRASIY